MKSSQNTQRTSFRAEREFGLLVGIMFVLLGSWWLYRGHWETVAIGFVSVGSLLSILGLLIPKLLVLPNQAWMGLAKILSLITTPIVLGVIFFLVFMPIGIIKRFFGWDPLRRRAPVAGSYWSPYNARQRDPRHFENMF